MYYLKHVGFFHTRQWFTGFDSKKYYANLGELETLLEKTPGVKKLMLVIKENDIITTHPKTILYM